jgi:hypothetical protein
MGEMKSILPSISRRKRPRILVARLCQGFGRSRSLPCIPYMPINGVCVSARNAIYLGETKNRYISGNLCQTVPESASVTLSQMVRGRQGAAMGANVLLWTLPIVRLGWEFSWPCGANPQRLAKSSTQSGQVGTSSFIEATPRYYRLFLTRSNPGLEGR